MVVALIARGDSTSTRLIAPAHHVALLGSDAESRALSIHCAQAQWLADR
jgi:hypothetical protein